MHISPLMLILSFQVTKLIEDSTLSKSVKNAIDTDRLLDWLVENSVLSIALEGKLLSKNKNYLTCKLFSLLKGANILFIFISLQLILGNYYCFALVELLFTASGSPLMSPLLGNIDQAQYCDRIKGIIELLGSKLSLDELTKIWKIQVS